MFLIRRPSQLEIEQFIDRSRELPLSYDTIGVARENPGGFNIDEATAVLGHGAETFARARTALMQWRHFELGWVELYPRNAAVEPGTVVAVLVRHLGFWSLNGCRVVYSTGEQEVDWTFGFAYGTLTNHGECGEELFEVSFNSESGQVTHRIRAVSKPRAMLARLGYPITRFFQNRFRRDSIAAMKRATD